MEKNVGKIDKTVRLIAGFSIIIVGVYFQSWLGVIGLIPITIALLGWCPVYTLLGMSTCKKNDVC